MKTYITFGQIHTHSVNGKTLDKDTVAVIDTPDIDSAYELITKYFGQSYGTSYPEKYWDESSMKYFPKGYVYL